MYGIFSDVHANLPALRAVLSFFRKNKVTKYVCCGDLVGYGPQPRECIEAVMDLKPLTIVMGNHDAVVTGRMDLKWFNQSAVSAIEATRKDLTGKTLDFLASAPEMVETREYTLVHASPRSHLKEYLISEAQFEESLKHWKQPPCFIGHSHMPLYFRKAGAGAVETDFLKPMNRVTMLEGEMAAFNPGSVGQPRDGNPFASCALYDPDRRSFEVFRLPYDVAETQRLMRERGLPQTLIDRLSFGL